MTLTDEQLRRALADRAASIVAGSLDPLRVARSVAMERPRPARVSVGLLSGLAAGIVVAAVVVGLVVRSAPPASSPTPSPSGSVASVVETSSTPSTSTPTAAPSTLIVGCDAMQFAPPRCDAVVARAKAQAGYPTDVVTVVVRRSVDGGITLGSVPLATVALIRGDGTEQTVELRCWFGGAISSDRACSDDPQIRLFGGVNRDTPCPGTEPCGPDNPPSKLPPGPRPASIAASSPLRVPSVDVPLDHVGHYEVPVGTASVPDGVMSERSASLADTRPTTFWIDDGVTIDVRSDIAGRPPVDMYYRDRFDGPEPVHIYLVFDVVEVHPGAVLQVRNLVVR